MWCSDWAGGEKLHQREESSGEGVRRQESGAEGEPDRRAGGEEEDDREREVNHGADGRWEEDLRWVSHNWGKK